ncbi:hypothetical protein BDM02DRAFT_3116193 [Thelephora ganbajun]|uniref:Uncharacterized protein n=1 Tax=Thelephora ganbajun TaxID=370292 RepID=A0ACB6ZEX4_THEGA|nr:hypothetical protein BDM02DRAFT_3116193 [Thelephora ganbajun]
MLNTLESLMVTTRDALQTRLVTGIKITVVGFLHCLFGQSTRALPSLVIVLYFMVSFSPSIQNDELPVPEVKKDRYRCKSMYSGAFSRH